MTLKPKRKRLVRERKTIVKREKLVPERKPIVRTIVPKTSRTKHEGGHAAGPRKPQQASVPQYNLKAYVNAVNRALGIRLTPDQTSEPALDVIKRMALADLTVESEAQSELLRRALAFLEKKLGEEPAWKKWLVMGGVEYAWFIARRVVPGFAAADDILNGFVEKNNVKIVLVIVNAVLPGGGIPVDCTTFLLTEVTGRFIDREALVE